MGGCCRRAHPAEDFRRTAAGLKGGALNVTRRQVGKQRPFQSLSDMRLIRTSIQATVDEYRLAETTLSEVVYLGPFRGRYLGPISPRCSPPRLIIFVTNTGCTQLLPHSPYPRKLLPCVLRRRKGTAHKLESVFRSVVQELGICDCM